MPSEPMSETSRARAQNVNIGGACMCGTTSPDYFCMVHQAIALAINAAVEQERERATRIVIESACPCASVTSATKGIDNCAQ